jgi:peptidoglycan/LPS O-acetylase OafA/YrhL
VGLGSEALTPDARTSGLAGYLPLVAADVSLVIASTPSPAPASDHLVIQAGQPRSARIESLRAVAALSVLVSHAFAYSHRWGPTIVRGLFHRVLLGGGFGVELFFVLSGYLMYRPFARRDFAGRGPIDLKTYARNRALRILPLYYVVAVVLLLVTRHGGSFEEWWRFLLFAQSFSTHTAQTVDGPMWSLIVELHFYVLLPLLAVAVARVARSSRALACLALLALGAPSLVLHYLNPHPFVIWQYSLPETFFYFVPGMMLAVAQLAVEQRRPSWLRGPIGNTDTWLLAGAGVWLIIFWRYSLVPLAGVASVLLLAAVVLPLRAGPLARLLDFKPLVLVGVASYSLYLWHVPIVEHLSRASWMPAGTTPLLLVAGAVSLAVATLSYLIIERPALRLRGRWENAAPKSPERKEPEDIPVASALESARR